jgi:hypothetical protein
MANHVFTTAEMEPGSALTVMLARIDHKLIVRIRQRGRARSEMSDLFVLHQQLRPGLARPSRNDLVGMFVADAASVRARLFNFEQIGVICTG